MGMGAALKKPKRSRPFNSSGLYVVTSVGRGRGSTPASRAAIKREERKRRSRAEAKLSLVPEAEFAVTNGEYAALLLVELGLDGMFGEWTSSPTKPALPEETRAVIQSEFLRQLGDVFVPDIREERWEDGLSEEAQGLAEFACELAGIEPGPGLVVRIGTENGYPVREVVSPAIAAFMDELRKPSTAVEELEPELLLVA